MSAFVQTERSWMASSMFATPKKRTPSFQRAGANTRMPWPYASALTMARISGAGRFKHRRIWLRLCRRLLTEISAHSNGSAVILRPSSFVLLFFFRERDIAVLRSQIKRLQLERVRESLFFDPRQRRLGDE